MNKKMREKINFEEIVSLGNLLLAWKEFIKGKKNKKDVQEFQRDLMSNIISLHYDLKFKKYKHSDYYAFNISDPKPRNIHKASVRDRLLHHALYRKLYPIFDKKFIDSSYSCRINKGVHKAQETFYKYSRKVGRNNSRPVYILKCDVKKFFASIDQEILIQILDKQIEDKDILGVLREIISSFNSGKICKGLPLGNLTSQLLVNIYMNEFDQYVKHILKEKYYIRYADDFVILTNNKNHLMHTLRYIAGFLETKLKLSLHPDKIHIRTLSSGVDFLGWVNFSNHRVLRNMTKKRMIRRIKGNPSQETIQSYLGLLSHGDTFKLKNKILL